MLNKLKHWVGIVLLILIWQSIHSFMNSPFVPSPYDTIAELIQQAIDGEIMTHMLYSLYRLLIAVFFALIIGVLFGLILSMNRMFDEIITPLIYILYPVPKVAFLPILFVFFGLGDVSKIILVSLILFFQITLSVYDAVKNIDKEIFLSARSLDLSQRHLYVHIILPAILPHVISTLKTSIGIGIAVLFFAETYATDKGLGYFIMNNWSLLNYEEMYAGIVVLGILGYVLFIAIDYIKRLLIKWS